MSNVVLSHLAGKRRKRNAAADLTARARLVELLSAILSLLGEGILEFYHNSHYTEVLPRALNRDTSRPMPAMYLLRLIALFAPIALASPPLPLQINLPSHLPPLPPSTHVILRTHHLPLVTVPISTRNNFLFRNLTAGTYDLDVACREYDFEKGMTVVIGEEGEVQVARADGNIVARSEVNTKVGEEGGDGDWKMKGRLEVEMRVTRRREWREERGGFSPLSLLQNPMILIAVVGLGIVVGMPYLLDNMDPEMRAEFEEQQKKSILSGGASTGNPLQNFDMAAWMAGKTSGGANRETEAVQESKSSGAGNSGGGGGAKKRRG